MTQLLTAARMRAIEQAAIAAGEATGLELMERAGRGVVEAVFAEWPALAAGPHRAAVLCGPGNNGGDGFVVARLLGEWGWDVEVFLFGDPAKLPPDARENCRRWMQMRPVGDMAQLDGAGLPGRPDVVFDGVFGTGLARRVEGQLARVLQGVDAMRAGSAAKVVAIDMPSGMCSDSGKSLGGAAAAHLTVSFHSAKTGHYLEQGPCRSGKLVVADIGLADAPPQDDRVRLVQPDVPDLSKRTAGHKYSSGHALILSGGAGRTGAARLAARGALRVGAGLVTLGVPPSAQLEVASQITAPMLRRVDTADTLSELLRDHRLNALCLGPGMGVERARELVPAALASRRAAVLDADALTAFARAPADLFSDLHDSCVLTPHGGEFARLFPDLAGKLSAEPDSGPAFSKVDATREAAARAGCVVLFKGPDTIIAAPDGRCSVSAAAYDRAAPWLATAGAGDVLSGFIAGLLARGFAPFEAAGTAAWLHVECALEFGPGLIAEDLPELLPAVFRKKGV